MSNSRNMLPAAAAFCFPWEFNSLEVEEGKSVRTLGRLVCYDWDESRARLSAQRGSTEHPVLISTAYVEPFAPIIGAQYLALGELEKPGSAGLMLRARVLTCVDGVNVALLQKAVHVQRSFFREREGPVGGAATGPLN